MKLSIITINRNNAEGLRRTLASVAAQTYHEIEHVIIDGASSDESLDVIKEYASQSSTHDVLWVSEKDNGIYNAMNKGIEIALGKRVVNALNCSELVEDKSKVLSNYIQVLNSGDLLAECNVTERMCASLESNGRYEENRVPIIFGNMLKDYGEGRVLRDCGPALRRMGRHEQSIQLTMADFYNGTINHDPTYIRSDLFNKYGLYDESLVISSDWKWFVKAVVFGGEKLYYAPIDVTIFDMTGVSETNVSLRKEERIRELAKMLPDAVLKDYETWYFTISQVKRLRKYHMWSLICFVERILYKLERWRSVL